MFWTAAMYEMRPFQVTDVINKYRFEDYFYSRMVTCGLSLLAGLIYLALSGFDVLKGTMVFLMTVYKLLDALADIPAFIAYPMYSIAAMVIIGVVGVFVFDERLTKRQWAVYAVVLVSVGLLNI